MSQRLKPRRVAIAALASVAAAAAYLTLWPIAAEPVAWNPPPPPPLAGEFEPNDKLRGIERLGVDVAHGPEATAIDSQGRVYTGTRDGKILRLNPASGSFEVVANTGGRPLGMAFDATGLLYVCDADKGLLALGPSGELRSLATGHGGVPFKFTDDVDVAPDGTVYFTDASSRFGIHQQRADILEHGGRGRLLAYHRSTGKTELLLDGLQFANGVAVAGDGSYVLVNETGAYRITRYWLQGPKRGTAEPFVDNLPGLPDNLTWSPARRAFWVALYSPRVPSLEALAPHPFLRKVILRSPRALQPEPVRRAFAIAIDETGRVVENLQGGSPDAYAPVTSVREKDGVLWIGSVERDGLGRIPAPPLPKTEGEP